MDMALATRVIILLAWLGLASALPADIPSAASFYVPSLPDIHQHPDRPLDIYAGQLPSDPKAAQAGASDVVSHLYFVMVKARRTADRERIIFWFNGGPGCSSFDGLMMETGPWRVNKQGGFDVAEGGWEEYTTMVYVDQPAGTGFSYASSNNYVHTLEQASDHYVEFMRNFYRVFPKYQHVDTYLAGESYAGQYIPYFATAILKSTLGMPLKGMAIGNGWIDARNQYPSYLEFAVKNNILKENTKEWKEAKATSDECTKWMASYHPEHEPINIHHGPCQNILLEVYKKEHKIVNDKDTCINIYDVRGRDTWPQCGLNWPYDIGPITKYLDRPDVVRALHATDHNKPWKECQHQIHVAVKEEKSNSSITLLPELLKKLPILIFAGDQDIICNYIGMENMIGAMTWNGATGLGTVKTESWSVAGSPAGTWVSSRNLTYAKIFNASHMAPFDVPHVTHDMMLRFMGMNFSAIMDGSARIPSSVGSVTKPIYYSGAAAPVASKTPEQSTAMWEAYYNAGSAAVVLFVVGAIIGTFFWCRARRRQSVQLPTRREGQEFGSEENIPLNQRDGDYDEDEQNGHGNGAGYGRGKGKGRAMDPVEPPIFDVGDGDSDDETEFRGRQQRFNEGPGVRIQ